MTDPLKEFSIRELVEQRAADPESPRRSDPLTEFLKQFSQDLHGMAMELSEALGERAEQPKWQAIIRQLNTEAAFIRVFADPAAR